MLQLYEIDPKQTKVLKQIQTWLWTLKPKVTDFCQMFVIAKKKSRTLGKKTIEARPRSEKFMKNL
jgi:hypothetical protein